MVDVNTARNKGEWSEVYAFLKLIAERRIIGAKNDALDPDPGQCLSILNVGRSDIVAVLEDMVTLKSTSTGHELAKASYASVSKEAKMLLAAIRRGGDSSFSIPGTAGYLNRLGCSQIAASNQDKRDISVGVADHHVGGEYSYGFSIKSDLGSPPTLLNASGATNIVFVLEPKAHGQNLLDANKIESRTKIMDRCAFLSRNCATIRFHEFQNAVFLDNLRLLDDGMPCIVAALVHARYFGKLQDYSCKGLLKLVADENPCRYPVAPESYYEIKLGRFLEAVALGMKPSQRWGGETDATGGYLIVKKDGELTAFYIYNRDRFRRYLVNNTRLEIASSSRHGFMHVWCEKGIYYVKLNLQIRFN